MGDLKSIEQAIKALPPAQLAEFRRWFVEYDAAAWDTQVEADIVKGKLDALAEEAGVDYRSNVPRREP